MQIGMATTVPTNDEQKAALRQLAHTLAVASDQARRATTTFGRVRDVITVENRDMGTMLKCLSEQVTQVVERAE